MPEGRGDFPLADLRGERSEFPFLEPLGREHPSNPAGGSMEVIDIAGAGISGLTAAIHLAENGFRVRVYEKARDVGSRFRVDSQALENWTGDGDVVSFLTFTAHTRRMPR